MLTRYLSLVTLCSGILFAQLAVFGLQTTPAAPPKPNDTSSAVNEAKSPLSIDVSSPRLLLQTFIENWNDATRKDRVRELSKIETKNQLQALLRAVRCLETDDQAEGVSLEAFRRARRVIDVLNYRGEISYDSLPEIIPGQTEFLLPTDQGNIVMNLVGGRWLFNSRWIESETVRMLQAFSSQGRTKYVAFSVRDLMPDFLQERALFLEHWQWIGIASLLLSAWLIQRIVGFFIRALAGAWTRRRAKGKQTQDAIRALSGALGYFAAAGLIALLYQYLELDSTGDKVMVITSKLIASIGLMLVAFRLADLIGARLRDAAMKTDSRLDDQLAPMLERSLKVLITIGAFLFVLDNLDVDIVSFLAGLGVVGIGVGLAAKDTFANFFGSLTVFADKPFQVGDWIVVGAVEGTVEEIGFRTTRIRTFYNSVVALPNSKLVDSAIDNMGARRWRRYVTRLGLLYSTRATEIEAFCEGIRQIVAANDRMRQDYYQVFLNDFGDSGLQVLVYVFFDVPDWTAELKARQDFMLEVIRLAEHLGVGFAYPTTSIQIDSTPERPIQLEPLQDESKLLQEVERFGPNGDLSRPGGSKTIAG